MERLTSPDVDPTPPSDSEYAVTVELSKLHPSRRANSVFRENTPVEIHAVPLSDGTEYSILIGKPIRSNDLSSILKSSSRLTYSGNIAATHFLNEEEEDLGGGLRSDLHILGELLNAPDDSVFLAELAGRLKSHDLAWSDLVNQKGLAQVLAREWDSYGRPMNDAAKQIIRIIGSDMTFWTEEQRNSKKGMNQRSLIERFGNLPPPMRNAVLEREMKRFGSSKRTEQRKRIEYIDGIDFEKEIKDQAWYLTGDNNIRQETEDQYQVAHGQNPALIKFNGDRFDIFPYSAFLLPTVTWKNIGGGRKLVVPSQFEKEFMTIPIQNKPQVRFQYKIDKRQLSNPVVGLLALQYILDFPAYQDLTAEYVPQLAVMRQGEILQKDFFKNAEQLAS